MKSTHLPILRSPFLHLLIGFAFATQTAGASTFSFQGNSLKVLEITPEASTGLSKIYVAYDLKNTTLSYASSGPVKWYRFSNLGGGFAEEITDNITYSDGKSTLNVVTGDMGYIVEEDGRQYCIWIVEYAPYHLKLDHAEISPSTDCDASVLLVSGKGEAIHYFTVLGQQRTLDREIEVVYNTLVWDENEHQYVQETATKSFEYLREELVITPPALCPTSFLVEGDRFLKAWNWLQKTETSVARPVAVDMTTKAEQISQDSSEQTPSNIIKTESETALGGSAPVAISFDSWVTDGVVHTEWQMARDPEFANIEYRFTEQNLEYTFTEEGTYYVRCISSNDNGSCTVTGETYAVQIGASELRIPNVFSPNGDGINDEWKVAYRSLLSFECWIFDRYGNQITHMTSPEQGWDGKRKGKFVAPGVYYYVIQAKGADGHEYKESGDINILRSENTSENQSSE